MKSTSLSSLKKNDKPGIGEIAKLVKHMLCK